MIHAAGQMRTPADPNCHQWRPPSRLLLQRYDIAKPFCRHHVRGNPCVQRFVIWCTVHVQNKQSAPSAARKVPGVKRPLVKRPAPAPVSPRAGAEEAADGQSVKRQRTSETAGPSGRYIFVKSLGFMVDERHWHWWSWAQALSWQPLSRD